MLQFRIYLRRYDKAKGVSIKSAPIFQHASDINGALKLADDLLAGMKMVDLEERFIYAVVTVTQEIAGFDIVCTDYNNIWAVPEKK